MATDSTHLNRDSIVPKFKCLFLQFQLFNLPWASATGNQVLRIFLPQQVIRLNLSFQQVLGLPTDRVHQSEQTAMGDKAKHGL